MYDMKTHPLSSLFAAGLCVLFAAGMIGCKSVPVDVLGVDGPDSLQTNQAGTFSASVNPDAKQPVDLRWDFGDNTGAEGTTATHSFGAAGTYNVTFTASNRGGKSVDSERLSVVVVNPPQPAKVLSISADNMNPDTRTAVQFRSSVSGDTPITYAWSFGDGSTGSGASPTHTFGQPGTYTVSLNASNKAGADGGSLTLTVVPYEAEVCRELAVLNAAFFGRNSSVLSDEARAALNDNLAILNECPNVSVQIEGVAAPGERRPQRLSEDRARAVEQFYIDGGVAASRISTTGKGRVTGITSKKEGTSQYRRADSIPVRN